MQSEVAKLDRSCAIFTRRAGRFRAAHDAHAEGLKKVLDSYGRLAASCATRAKAVFAAIQARRAVLAAGEALCGKLASAGTLPTPDTIRSPATRIDIV